MARRLSARTFVPFALVALALACTAPPPSPPPGPPRALATPGEEPIAEDVNDTGMVVGWSTSTDGGNRLAWRQIAGDPVELLDPTGTTDTYVMAVNHHGTIVGIKDMAGTVWQPDGRTPTLPPPDLPIGGGGPATGVFFPRDINDQGIVVGDDELIGAAIGLAVVWDPATGRSSLLPTLDCSVCGDLPAPGMAVAVNNRGQIIGQVFDGGTYVDVLWNPTGGGRWAPPQRLPLGAADIDDRGTIVGTFNGSPARWRGPGHEVTVLPTPEGATGGATAVNAGGVIVGTLTRSDLSRTTAFRWAPGDRSVTELAGLGGDTAAVAIGDSGVIVGHSSSSPEPEIRRVVRWDPPPPGPR
jgi:uncharacterized membrane protein